MGALGAVVLGGVTGTDAVGDGIIPLDILPLIHLAFQHGTNLRV